MDVYWYGDIFDSESKDVLDVCPLRWVGGLRIPILKILPYSLFESLAGVICLPLSDSQTVLALRGSNGVAKECLWLLRGCAHVSAAEQCRGALFLVICGAL